MKPKKQIPAQIDTVWLRLFPAPLQTTLYLWAHQFEDVTHDPDGKPLAWMHPGIMQCDDPNLAGRDGYTTDEAVTLAKNGDRAYLAAGWDNFANGLASADIIWKQAAHYQWMCVHGAGESVDGATLAKWREEKLPNMDDVLKLQLVPPYRNLFFTPADKEMRDSARDKGHRLSKEIRIHFAAPEEWTAFLPVGSPIRTVSETDTQLVGYCWHYLVFLKPGEWTTVETSQQAAKQPSEGMAA